MIDLQAVPPKKGNGHLRSIALTIHEAEPGQFTWRLSESIGDDVVYDETVLQSEEPFAAYGAALAAGYQAWCDVCAEDMETGPRVAGEDESGDPVGPQDVEAG